MNDTHQNFVHGEPNSQFYTDLNQIENSLQFGGVVINNDHILIGIKNTIKMGYRIIPPESMLLPVLSVNDIVIYKTDGCGGVPIIAEIKAVTNDDTTGHDTRLIYTLKSVYDGRLFSTINRKRIVKWDNEL